MPLQTVYTRLLADTPEESGSEEVPPRYLNEFHTVHEESNVKKARWNHIENLDVFFRRVYKYYINHGLTYMILNYVFELMQFLFIILFTTFLITCVDYPVLFGDKLPSGHTGDSHKVTIPDAVRPLGQCVNRFTTSIICFLVIAFTSWAMRLIRIIWNLSHFIEIKSFYSEALKISTSELQNITWQEVQNRMMKYQLEHQMCIHKEQLSELDITHRISRFTNYLVAMVNKDIIPVRLTVPLIGQRLFFTKGYLYNLEAILFWAPGSPFDNDWHLRPDYKKANKRQELAEQLSTRIFYFALLNIVLSPIIFIWQILFSFFSYAEIIRRDPGRLGIRRWSLYSRHYLRHFNELDHDLNLRLGRAYKPASKYMNIFYSHLLALIAKNIAFFAGAMLAVLLALTIYDEFLLTVEHVLTAVTVLGVIITSCRTLIPNEQDVQCPHKAMKSILCHIHYMPDDWKTQAHTVTIREEFSTLFQYKLSFYLEELLSPLITPFVLLYALRTKSLTIIDFFRQFTIEVEGVGDVCSFAEMDIKRHGDPKWLSSNNPERNQQSTARDGKMELSLINFQMKNPEWKPNPETSQYISKLKEQAISESASFSSQQHLLSNLSSLHFSTLFNSRPATSEDTTSEGIATNMQSMQYDYRNTNSAMLHPSLGFVDGYGLPLDATHQSLRDHDINMSTLMLHEMHDRRVNLSSSNPTSPRDRSYLRQMHPMGQSAQNNGNSEEKEIESTPSQNNSSVQNNGGLTDGKPPQSYGTAHIV